MRETERRERGGERERERERGGGCRERASVHGTWRKNMEAKEIGRAHV